MPCKTTLDHCFESQAQYLSPFHPMLSVDIRFFFIQRLVNVVAIVTLRKRINCGTGENDIIVDKLAIFSKEKSLVVILRQSYLVTTSWDKRKVALNNCN